MISLIVATLGRKNELEELFDSLEKQTNKEFEVIIVDQNNDDLIDDVIKKYIHKFSIKHIKSNVKGLSINRNIGLKNVEGNIVAFTDDDCKYDSKLIETVVNDFNNEDVEIISYKIIDPISNIALNNSPNIDMTLDARNILQCCLSASLFIRFKSIKDIRFNENFGIGANYGSCEDSELILRLLMNEYKGIFYPKSIIMHPIKEPNYSVGYNYGLGLGAYFKKAIIYYKQYKFIYKFLYEILKSLGGCILRYQRKDYYFNTLKGRIKGFYNYREVDIYNEKNFDC